MTRIKTIALTVLAALALAAGAFAASSAPNFAEILDPTPDPVPRLVETLDPTPDPVPNFATVDTTGDEAPDEGLVKYIRTL
jgi:hypothetical protein